MYATSDAKQNIMNSTTCKQSCMQTAAMYMQMYICKVGNANPAQSILACRQPAAMCHFTANGNYGVAGTHL